MSCFTPRQLIFASALCGGKTCRIGHKHASWSDMLDRSNCRHDNVFRRIAIVFRAHEGIAVIAYEPGSETVDPELPAPGRGLRWEEFVDALAKAYEAGFDA